MPTFRIAAALPLLLFLLTGCSDKPTVVAVKGTVTRGGKPLKSLLVTFYPEDGGRSSSGRSDDQGHFELKYDNDTKGATLGNHKVAVAFKPLGPKEEAADFSFHPEQDAILEKYGQRATTPLSVEITRAESDLQLKLD